MKVLHVLETSLPDPGGYTIRAKSIIDQQRNLGVDVVVVTSPLFPQKGVATEEDLLDGVRYFRTNHIPIPASARSKLGSYVARVLMLHRYRQAVMKIVERERPDVIHSHSSYSNAFAAMPAADKFNIPLIYEVRTLWGESAVIEDKLSTDSWKYKLVWALELKAMRRADAIIPIAQGIYDELARRGIDTNKMHIVPNGVDVERFVSAPRDEDLCRKYGLDGKFVVGFIGSMRRLEGLSTLVRAYAALRRTTDDIRIVIVGDGPDRADLERLSKELGVDDTIFTGNVPFGDVASWYSVLDVLVYPRIRATINERITPLKPLEAMALGKVCVGSDVGGLKELISDDVTGVIFPAGDSDALVRVLLELKADTDRRHRLQASALEFINRERKWSAVIQRTMQIYQLLLKKA